MKYLITLLLSIVFSGIIFSQDKTTYEAWLDSMGNPEYVMSNVLYLDEMELLDNQYESANPLLTKVRKDKLMSTDDLLHCLPGVNMMRRGNFASEPVIRGLSSERYVVSIDGMRLFGACTDKMDPASSYIEPNNLASLDISLGNDDVMDGSTTGGCVKFNLKSPKFNSNRAVFARLGVKYNSVANGFDQLADVNVNKNNIALRVSFVHRKSKNYLAGGGNEIEHTQFEKYNYSLALSYRLPKDQMFSFTFLGDDANDVGYPALPMDVSFAKAKMASLNYYRQRLGKLKEIDVKVYYNNVDHAMDDTKRAPEDVPMHMDMPGNTHTTGAYVEAFIRDSLKTKLEFYNTFAHAEMTMYPENGSSMFMLTYPDVHRNSITLSLEYKKQVLKNTSLNLGGRYENSRTNSSSAYGEQQLNVFGLSGKSAKHMNLFGSSIAITTKLSNRIAITYKNSYGERLPTTSEQYGFYIFNSQDGFDYLGNPDINKEKSWQNEISATWHTKKLRTDVAIYHYQFSDFIMGLNVPNYHNITFGAKGVKFYENTSQASLMGAEWSLMSDITTSTHFMTTATYSLGYDYENDPLPLMPPLKITGSIYQKWKGFEFQPEIIWSSPQKRINKKADEIETNAFLLINFRVFKSLFIEKQEFNLAVGIENLSDANYREHLDWGGFSRPGRNFFLNVSWKIGG